MKVKRFTIYLLLYSVIVLSVFVCFNDIWIRDLPTLNHYEGNLNFSGTKAYEDVKFLTSNFPDRKIGTENAKASAQWIYDEFSNIGLITKYEEFECQALLGNTLDQTIDKKSKGINVIGVSKGSSDDIILIGAHRDTILFNFGDKKIDNKPHQGAQDNATGTASMLELARVLTNKEHKYTYVFVSFDGEEIGLKGASYFLKNNSKLPIKLAMVLDCVGYSKADTVGIYQFAGSKGSSPLWSTALARSIMRSMDMKPYYLDDEGGMKPLTLGLLKNNFGKIMAQRSSGDVNTDTGPFVNHNIPSIGFIAAKAGEIIDPEMVYHTTDDVISYASVETLGMIGKIAEQYILSMDLNSFSRDLNSNHYLVIGDKYIGEIPIVSFIVIMFVVVFLLWVVSSSDVLKNFDQFLEFLKRELKWIISIALISIFSGFSWLILNTELVNSIKLPAFFLVWLLVNFIAFIIIFALRLKSVRNFREDYYTITKKQRDLLNTVYTLMFIFIAIYINPFAAMLLMFLPLLLMGRVGFKNVAVRVLWAVILVVWSVFQTGFLLVCLQPFVFEIPTVQASVLIAINSFVWITTFIYTISTPKMQKRNLIR